MLLRRAAMILALLVSALPFDCGKKGNESTATPMPSGNDALPPKASPADAPEFVRSLSLIYPQAELYRVENRIVQKTNHRVTDIADYYARTFGKHGFQEIAKLEQANGALLQYERRSRIQGTAREVCAAVDKNCKIAEVISVDVTRLPYADNFLIRVGRSEVDYSKGEAKPQ